MNPKKKLAGNILGVSPKKVVFQPEAVDDIAKAITRSDIRGLIAVKKITVAAGNQRSRVRVRGRREQRRKGRRSGYGSRKGKANARQSSKRRWVFAVRAQRRLLHKLRHQRRIAPQVYSELYRKVKGGFFRNTSHVMLYLKEYKLLLSP